MTDQEFDQQYEKAKWASRLLSDLVENDYFSSLSAENLFEALCERMEEQMSLEESEIKTILGVIADRLGRLEEMSSAGDEPDFYHDQGDGFCYKCRRGHSECRCNRISLELETAITNLGAEIAMATNALPSRRIAGVMDAFKKVQEESGAIHRD